jgi:four helix bundle protein
MENGRIQNFRDLDAWKVAMDLAVLSYEAAKKLPVAERYELAAQIRRGAVSVPSNIAEGHACGRNGRRIHHARIALGSLGELATDFELTRRLGMLTNEDLGTVETQLEARRSFSTAGCVRFASGA